jgi:hypothetical protein
MCEMDWMPQHRVNMSGGRYVYNVVKFGGYDVQKGAVFTDDGIIHDGTYYVPHMFETTVRAMEAEAAAGLFEPKMWIFSFPRRTLELWQCMENLIGKEVDLPPPLVKIITQYIWGF